MNIVELMDLYNELEEKFEVDKWTVDDIHVWPIIRMDLMLNLFDLKARNKQTNINLLFKIKEGLKILKGVLKYLFAVARDGGRNEKISQADTVFLSDGISRVKLKEKFHDKFCDPIIDILQKKGLSAKTLEPLHNYIIPRYRASIFIQKNLDFSLIKNMFFKAKNPSHDNLPGFHDFLDFLDKKNYGTPLPDEKRIKTILTAINAYSEVFDKLLAYIKPKIGLVVCYYGPIGLAFVQSCKRLKIPCADLQHGAEGDFHPAYGRFAKVPEEGYEFLPDFFFCWSENEVSAIDKWSKKINRHNPINAGNTFLDLWRNNENEIVKYYDKIIHNSLDQNPDAKNILLTLSYDYDNEEILGETLKAMRNSQQNLKWWVRLHPIALKRREKVRKMLIQSGIKNFNLDMATDFPLHALLRNIDLHITHASGTVVEAAQFGVPSIITSENAIQYYKEEIGNGYAVFAAREEEIVRAINSQLTKKPYLTKPKIDKTDIVKIFNEIMHAH